MRLFRQPARGDWESVFSEIGEALSDLRRKNPPSAPDTAHSPTIPVSWGELIDKITILEIKSERIENEKAQLNITTELRALSAAAGAVMGAYPELGGLRLSLRAVNERLWDIEDEIREKERMKIFDETFIALARAVYTFNDDRARLKRRINALTESQISEEKSYTTY
jgi:hypothetical protein